MKKIEDIPYIDKVVNFIIGGVLYFVLLTTFTYQICFIIILCTALLKECYDWHVKDYQNVDLWDTCCVMLGAMLAAIL